MQFLPIRLVQTGRGGGQVFAVEVLYILVLKVKTKVICLRDIIDSNLVEMNMLVL